MAELALEGLTKRFAGVTAVEGLTLIVGSGELVTLVGPSGCGKTTALRLIAGFEVPDAGDIKVDGRTILQLPPEARRVGMVFQNYALFPHMNVFDNIAYGLKFAQGPKGKRRRVEELLDLMSLQGLEQRRPGELSAGQQQRAALARALAPEPKLLLLDEPLSALDAKLRERLRLEIKRLQRSLKITTIYVTHDQEEALAISDRLAVMSTAQVEQLGTPLEVYNRPATEFVASFIGRGNLLSAVVEGAKGGTVKLRLLPDGLEIAAEAEEGYRSGQEVKLLIRPERIRLDDTLENLIRGRLRALEFLGDSIWAHLDAGGKELRVKLPPQGLELEEGQELELSFSPKDCHLIPAGDSLRGSRATPPTPGSSPAPGNRR